MTRNTTLGLVVMALALSACSMVGAPPSAATPTPTHPPSSTPAPTPTPTPTSPPASDPSALSGRQFLSTNVTDRGAVHALVPGTVIRITFQDGQLSANAGCNTMGGTFSVDTDTLVFHGGAMTEMGCDQARHDQDDWVFGFLGSQPTVALDGNNLVLTGETSTVTMLDREVAEPDQPLTGRVWTLNSIISGDSVSSVPAGITATIKFNDDGSVEIHPGCNSGRGSFTAIEGSLQFSKLVTTKMACVGAGDAVESAVLGVLSAQQVDYEIDAGVLTMLAGNLGLTFTAP